MPQRDAARRVENLGPRPPRFLYYSVSEAPALHSKQLFCIRSIKSVSKSFGPYPKCWFRVCNARSVSKTYLPRLTYSDESAHFHFAPGAKPWNLSSGARLILLSASAPPPSCTPCNGEPLLRHGRTRLSFASVNFLSLRAGAAVFKRNIFLYFSRIVLP